MTFLSMIALRISACLPTTTLCSSTARSTVAQLLMRTPGESTEPRTRPPDTITPLETSESIARPTRSPLSCTNLAGGTGHVGEDGPPIVYRLNIGSTVRRSMCESK